MLPVMAFFGSSTSQHISKENDFHKSAMLLIWNDKVVLGYMSLPYVYYEIERDCSFSHKRMIYCHRLLYKIVIIVAYMYDNSENTCL
jgi:hypothetical protein